MAFVAARGTQILCNGYDISSYHSHAGLSLSWTLAETTTFGQVAKTRIATTNSGSLSFDGVWDPTWDGIVNGLSGADGSIVSYMPTGGATIGDRAWSLYGAATQYEPQSSPDEAVRFSWSAESEARVICGNILHPLGEDTNTTTGSSRNDSAATTSGWSAVLHVTLVDAGSWVVKLEDSANNSAWSDVSGGAFSAVTGITSQRLVSASGATLRQYVRYTATRTGGSAGDGITFALIYERQS